MSLELARSALTGLPQLQESRGVFQPELHVERYGNERDTEEERLAPTPTHECLLRGIGSHQQEGKVGENDADRCTGLGETTVKSAPGWRRTFCGNQNRASPLTADGYPLHVLFVVFLFWCGGPDRCKRLLSFVVCGCL